MKYIIPFFAGLRPFALLVFLVLVTAAPLRAQVDFCPVLPAGPVSAGEVISIPIEVTNYVNISGSQGIILYDTLLLQFTEFTVADPSIYVFEPNPGEIRLGYADFTGSSLTLDDNTAFVDLDFNVKQTHDDVSLDYGDSDNSVFPFEVVIITGNTIDVYWCGELIEVGNYNATNTAFDPETPVDFCPLVPDFSVGAGEFFSVPIYVTNYTGVGWYELPLLFDTDDYVVTGIDLATDNPEVVVSWQSTETGAALIGLEWSGAGYSQPDGSLLLTVLFEATNNVDNLAIAVDADSPAFRVANNIEQEIFGLTSSCSDEALAGLPVSLVASVVANFAGSCSAAPDADPLAGWTITCTADADGSEYAAVSGPNGRAYLNLPPGEYTYAWTPGGNPGLWEACPTGTLDLNEGGLAAYSESVAQPLAICSELTVNVSSFNLRPCFTNNRFIISYANYGTAPADDAYLDLVFDPSFTPLSASLAYEDLGNNLYRFQLGDLGINANGTISVDGQVDCGLPVGVAVCAEATIYPFRTECIAVDDNFQGGELNVTSQCDGDSIRFRIENVGDGPTGPVEFTVIEDVIIYMSSPADLMVGEVLELSVPARGTTFRLETDRPAFAPYQRQGLAIQEGCGQLTGGGISTGFVTGLPLLDGDKYFDRYCQQTSAAYDPNDKQAIPTGVGNQNFVAPNQTMDYKIRFQNTGTDTAFNVVIVDTIDVSVFDLASFRPGVASHPYYVQREGNEIRFLFDDIQLVDSLTNEPGSHGFVHFSIAQRPDLPDGTILENRAGIYFDFNPPIITNYSQQTIGRAFLTVKVSNFDPSAADIRVYPSPTAGDLHFELPDVSDRVAVTIYDMFGRTLRTAQLNGERPTLSLADLPAGRYAYRLQRDGQWLQTGIVVKN